jgi:subtilisin family serine protease
MNKNILIFILSILIISTFGLNTGIFISHYADGEDSGLIDDSSEANYNALTTAPNKGAQQTKIRANDKNSNKIHDALENQIGDIDSAFITYYYTPTQSDIIALELLGIEIIYIGQYVDVIQIGKISTYTLKEIVSSPGVRFIEPVPEVKPQLDVSSRAVKARDSSEYSPNTAWEFGYTGYGISIAILDTGVDDGHPSLQGKFVAGADFVGAAGLVTPKDGSYNPDDDTGHGTAVAGIAMGTGGGSETYRGIAPDARLIDVRVSLGRGGNLLEAFDWCINNHDTDWNNDGYGNYDGIDIISISMGGSEDSDGSEPIAQIINQAVDAGIVVVVATGNDGPNNQGLGDVAAADKAITVGNLNDRDTINRNDDDVDGTSSRGPRSDDGDSDAYDELKPDVVAPGINIMAPDFNLAGQNSDGYTEFSGSSYSTPHVSGICALMLEANPKLRPRDVKTILHDTAEAMGDPDEPELSDKYNYVSGFGSVDAYEAVKVAKTHQIVNHAPVLKSVSADPKFIRPNEESTITTVAIDPDDDPLNYEYSASAGEFRGSGAEVTWIAPDQLGEYEISVEASDGIDKSEIGKVIITVEDEPGNHEPVIENVEVQHTEVEPGESSGINVTASDIDDDELFYEYSATGGKVVGTGPKVVWMAPDEVGVYKIVITVTDGELSADSELEITVSVPPGNEPPLIESFTATNSRVETGKTLRLSVTATDPEASKLQYTYSAISGEILGEGANVDWHAPDTPGNYVIRVTVKDNAGLTDSDELSIDVYQPNLPPMIVEKRALPNTIKNDGTVEVLFTVTVDDKNGLDDINRVEFDLSSIFGSKNQKMYDNGRNGDQNKFDGVYSYAYVVPGGVTGGTKALQISVSDNTGEVTREKLYINITAVPEEKDEEGMLGGYLPTPGFDGEIIAIAFIMLIFIMITKRTRIRRS